MHISLNHQFEGLSRVLSKELAEILEPLAVDPDNYGFALGVPEDVGSAFLMYAVGKESKLIGEQYGSAFWLDRRYSAVEWTASWSEVPQSTGVLQEAVGEFNRVTDGMEGRAFDEAHEEFITACATACMDSMVTCNTEGKFGDIWYKVLFMSDTEHRVISKAFRRLNSGRALNEASSLFPTPYMKLRFAAKAFLAQIRAKWVRWKIGAKRK